MVSPSLPVIFIFTVISSPTLPEGSENAILAANAGNDMAAVIAAVNAILAK